MTKGTKSSSAATAEHRASFEALERAVKEVHALLGKDVLRTYNQQPDITVYPTDFAELNKATNIGGIPMGKIIEVFGKFSSGKTSLSWQLATALIRATRKKALFLDYEGATSKPYLQKLGVPVEDVYFGLPEQASLEDGFKIIDILVPTGAFCCVIVDSLAAMVPKAEYDSVTAKGLEGQDGPIKAKIMHRAMRRYSPFFRKYNTTMFFINHVNAKIQMGGPMVHLGEKEETPGGNAVKFYSDMRLNLIPTTYVTVPTPSAKDPKKKKNVKVGHNVTVRFVKNRVGEPFGEAELTLRKGHGFDVATSVIKRGIAEGVIVKKSSGAHYLKDDEKIQAPSYDRFWNLVISNPQLMQDILDKLNGKAVTYKAVDMTAAERELTTEELGLTDKDVIEDESTGPASELEI
jgi:recombination protein RecA